MASRLKLRPAQRLRRNADFVRIRRGGKPYRCSYFALYSISKEEAAHADRPASIGISASKRVGKAVTRNAIKRRIREIFRLNQHRIDSTADIVISIRPPAVKASFEELERRFLHAIKYNGLHRKKFGEQQSRGADQGSR